MGCPVFGTSVLIGLFEKPCHTNVFLISEHQISLFTSQNAPEIFLGLAAQNGIVITPRHLFYFNLLSLSL